MSTESASLPQHHADSRFRIAFLTATSFICGAAVMILEVLGSRVIGPFFGASLYVWTSLITVTMIALAAGYWAGGRVSDRARLEHWLYGIIFAAGIAILLIPVCKGIIIRTTLPLGLRVGSLASAGMMFAPALFLLGAVSPLVIRSAVREMSTVGRTVGFFSSVSTIGSFVGTLATGFILIAYFPIDRILVAVGSAMLLVSLTYFLLTGRKTLLLPVFILPFLIPAGGELKSKTAPNGTRVSRVFWQDTFYGNMQVLDYSFNSISTRELLVDATIQGGIDLATGLSIYEYPYLLQFIPRALNPAGRECLVVGLGPGAVPMWYERQGVRTDVVDIDPKVFEVARNFFGFRNSGGQYAEDARYFLNRTAKKYDYIILDVFNGDNSPFHVLSREALQTVKERLAPGGILGINYLGALNGNTYITASIIRTLKQVFRTAEIYPAFAVSPHNAIGNIEIFAYDREPLVPDRRTLESFSIHPLAAGAAGMMLAPFQLPPDLPSIVLTDNYNPVDFFDLDTKEFIRRQVIKMSDLDFLLS